MADQVYTGVSSVRMRPTKMEETAELKQMNLEDAMEDAGNRVSAPEESMSDVLLGSHGGQNSGVFSNEQSSPVRIDTAGHNEDFLKEMSSFSQSGAKPLPTEQAGRKTAPSKPVKQRDLPSVPDKVTAGAQKLADAETIAKQTAKAHGKRIYKEERLTSDTVTLRNVPKAILYECKREFPNAKTQTDAIVAWIVAHASSDFVAKTAPSLTEEQTELVQKWDMSPDVFVERNLTHIVDLLNLLRRSVDTVELLGSYLVFDRVGFRKENPASPASINLMEEGVIDTVIKAETQTGSMRNQRNIIKGRRPG